MIWLSLFVFLSAMSFYFHVSKKGKRIVNNYSLPKSTDSNGVEENHEDQEEIEIQFSKHPENPTFNRNRVQESIDEVTLMQNGINEEKAHLEALKAKFSADIAQNKSEASKQQAESERKKLEYLKRRI